MVWVVLENSVLFIEKIGEIQQERVDSHIGYETILCFSSIRRWERSTSIQPLTHRKCVHRQTMADAGERAVVG